MADKEAGEKKSKKGLMIPAVVLAVGLAGGGYFMSAGKKAESADHGPATTTTTVLGRIVRLEPITLNLSDGHVLKVGMALQTIENPQHAHMIAALAGGGHGAAPDASSPLGGEEAKALDEAIHVLGDSTFEELSKPGGRHHAKEELSKQIKHIYEGDVTDVYFTDFVMS